MKKAKSRLPRSLATTTKKIISPVIKLLKKYLLHLPLAAVGASLWVLVIYILHNIPPSEIQDIFLINSYIVFIITVWGGVFFCSTYLLLNTRRGFLVASAATILLWLKIQQVIISDTVIVTILTWFGILELLLTAADRHNRN